jgi:hypothetical protein
MEKNSPVCSKSFLMEMVRQVLEREGVVFRDSGVLSLGRCWRLYRMLQFLAPVAVLVSGRPVSLHGLGSYRLVRLGGRDKLQYKFSRSVMDCVGISKSGSGSGDLAKKFWALMDLFIPQGKGDPSLLKAEDRLFIDLR